MAVMVTLAAKEKTATDPGFRTTSSPRRGGHELAQNSRLGHEQKCHPFTSGHHRCNPRHATGIDEPLPTKRVRQACLDNPFFFTGRITDTLHADDIEVDEDGEFKRIQDNRNRTYDPKHGRWLQRDPLGVRPTLIGLVDPRLQYSDEANLYVYVRSRPANLFDAMGTSSCEQRCDKFYRTCKDVKPPINACQSCYTECYQSCMFDDKFFWDAVG